MCSEAEEKTAYFTPSKIMPPQDADLRRDCDHSGCDFGYAKGGVVLPSQISKQKTKSNKMGNLLYIIAVILIIGWAIGFFGYAAGGIIHVLLVIAIVLILLKFIRREA